MRSESGSPPAGRSPIVSTASDSLAVEAGHRAFSATSARRAARWTCASSLASDAADSERISTSMDVSNGIALTDVPPFTTLTLNVVLGDVGVRRSAMAAIARPNAWAGFGIPKSW